MNSHYHVRPVGCGVNLLESLYQDLSLELAWLAAEPKANDGWPRLRTILAALPLTTTEYAVAVNRLASAELYAAQGELGALKFELTQLARKLTSLGKASGAHAECCAGDLSRKLMRGPVRGVRGIRRWWDFFYECD
ncbi:MAG: hypothetical protein ABSF26_12565 [Thermoguttaceae bacterium]